MEFFRYVPCPQLDSEALKSRLVIEQLPQLCASIDTVLHADGNDGEIYCLWGSFTVRRDELRHGVRFSLLNCPHALAWTVTRDETGGQLIVHCCIDKQQQEQEFTESIDMFLDDWQQGLQQALCSTVSANPDNE